MISVTVYSTGPSCPQCKFTCKRLDDLGVVFSVVDITEDGREGLRHFLTEDLGYSQAPVVMVDGEPENHWSGFRAALIDLIAARAAEERAQADAVEAPLDRQPGGEHATTYALDPSASGSRIGVLLGR
ncbi:glutaredoxin family protein [Microbacterium pumilum]|uniref:Glutaredoxin domain-containing protein n=1 Tax=Microbacterium pumilum TaxID=344165 RepID=A0ABN2S2K8_9MICO